MEKNYNIADEEWEWYIGQLYYKLIKNLYKGKINTVVELAPGFRHKIADALKELDFTGTIYVIDPSIDVINYIKDKYKEIIPKAKIIGINKSFNDSISYVPSEIDLFLSNHCVDDIIMSKYSNEEYNTDNNNELLFNDLQELWRKLYNDKDEVERLSKEVLNEFKSFFDNKTIKLIVMGQYKSNLYYLDKSKYMDEIVEKTFNMIKELTNTNDTIINKLLDFYPFGKDDERYNGKYLTDNTQNAKNWIAGEKND